MNDRFRSLELFVRVAKTQSFSVASRELRISQPTASRMVAALEKKVGTTLLNRTTRVVTLTEAGMEYLARVEGVLSDLDEADHAARGGDDLRGLLRVAASSSFVERSVIPRLARFTDLHPRLSVEFIVNDDRQDLVADSVDVAVRVGALAQSSAVAKKLGINRRVLVASPAYLGKAGTPRSPGEINQHAVIIGPAGRSNDGWTFRRNGTPEAVRIDARFVFNSSEHATAAALAGLGLLSCGELGISGELENGSLVRLLPEWEMGTAEVHVILPAGRAAKPSARAFADFLVAELGHEPRRTKRA